MCWDCRSRENIKWCQLTTNKKRKRNNLNTISHISHNTLGKGNFFHSHFYIVTSLIIVSIFSVKCTLDVIQCTLYLKSVTCGSDVQRTFLSAFTTTHWYVWQLSIFLILQRCCRRRFQLWRMNVWAGSRPAGSRISFQTSHDWACPQLPPFPAPVSPTRYTWGPHGKNTVWRLKYGGIIL